jgi:hypothetical protein
MNSFDLPAIDAVRAHPGLGRSKDQFLIGDMSQTAARFAAMPANNQSRRNCSAGNDWTGGMAYDDSLRRVHEGCNEAATKSDAYLSKLEARDFVSRKFVTVASVAGGLPCVPAALAGHPLAMRQRRRQMTDSAPLAIIVDVASSGSIRAPQLEKRGGAVTALVRLLSAVRPVSLYIGCSVTLGGTRDATHVFCRMDTAPIDLARTAHMLTHASVARGMFYGLCYERGGAHGDERRLKWPYAEGPKLIRAHAHAILSRAIPEATESLYIGAAFEGDECIDQPEKWLQTMLEAHGGQPVTEAA